MILNILYITLSFGVIFSLVYFGGLYSIKFYGIRKLRYSNEGYFLNISDANQDYINNLDNELLNWFFAFSAKIKINEDYNFKDDSTFLKQPNLFSKKLSNSYKTPKNNNDFLSIASIEALMISINLSKNNKRLENLLNVFDPVLSSQNNFDYDNDIFNNILVRYKNDFLNRLKHNSRNPLNMSELASLSNICKILRIKPTEYIFSHLEFDNYLNKCMRLFDKKFVGYSINPSINSPCTCGTYFWNQLAMRSKINPYNSPAQNDIDYILKGLEILLNETYNEELGAFSAYPGGIPTIMHTEYALRLYCKINNYEDFSDNYKFDFPADEERLLNFVKNCYNEDGGFGLYLKRKSNTHALKCGISIIEEIRIKNDENEGIYSDLNIDLENVNKYISKVLSYPHQ